MFTRQQLADRLSDFERRRKEQSKAEMTVLFSTLTLMVLLLFFMPTDWRSPLTGYIFAGVTIPGLIAFGFIIDANTKRAQKAAGLVCPSCLKFLGHLDVLHIVLHDSCKHCKATVYHT